MLAGGCLQYIGIARVSENAALAVAAATSSPSYAKKTLSGSLRAVPPRPLARHTSRLQCKRG